MNFTPNTFRYDWFADIESEMAAVVPTNALRIVEVGSFEGRSTVWFMQHCPMAELVAIDHFKGGADQSDLDTAFLLARFSANTAKYADRITVYKMDAWQAWRCLDSERYDVVFIDGSHEAFDVIHDLTEAYRVVRNGGIVIADDYTWHNEKSDCPKVAIDMFAEQAKDRIQILRKTRLFVCKRLH